MLLPRFKELRSCIKGNVVIKDLCSEDMKGHFMDIDSAVKEYGSRYVRWIKPYRDENKKILPVIQLEVI